MRLVPALITPSMMTALTAGVSPAGPPEVPPPAPNMTTDYALNAFDEAVSALKQLMTKPAARFACSVHADDLEGVESFIRAVAERARQRQEKKTGMAAHMPARN